MTKMRIAATKTTFLILMIAAVAVSTPANGQISGACCLPDNTCVNVVDFECFSQGGLFNPGQDCASVDCVSGPTGACCSTDLVTGGFICEENLFELDCLSRPGGTFFRGQTCDQIPCSNIGACCTGDGFCTDNVLFSDCLGEFIPGGSCADEPCFTIPDGACCFPDGTCVDFYPEDFCFFDGGRWVLGGVCGDPETCNIPIIGACCIDTTTCIPEITQDDCLARDGTFFEGAICFNLPCAPIPDPGACCLPNGTCAELIEFNCIEEENGVFLGEGTTCSGDICSGPPCLCEVDGDTAEVNVLDLLFYLNLWFAGDPAAELDEIAGVDVFDLLIFLDCWFAGCA